MTRDPVGDLDRFRTYLRLLARAHLKPHLRGKLDPSDLVQDALVKALQVIDQFRGLTDAELAGWLRQILARHMANAVRDFARQKRNTAREVDGAAAEQSSVRLEAWLAAEQSSPNVRAERNEDLARLAAAIEALPEAQAEAVTQHHLLGWTLNQVAEQMDRSPAAVAGLIKRGLRQLRHELAPDDPDR